MPARKQSNLVRFARPPATNYAQGELVSADERITYTFPLCVIFLFLRVQKLYEIRKGLYLSGLIILAYLLIVSVAESAFAHPMAISLAVWLGILMKEREKIITV